MKTGTRRTAVLLSTAGLLAGSAVLPAPAAAADTECEPGSSSIIFRDSATGREAAGSLTLRNTATVPVPVPATAEDAATSRASLTGPVSLDAVLRTLRTDVTPLAFESATWRAGQSIIQLTLPAGQSHEVTYGFNLVSFSGSRQECGLHGLSGPASDFTGTVPTGTYVEY